MAIICRSYNLLFVMTPRTGCTAIGEVLCKELGGEYVPSEDVLDLHGYFQVDRKHNTLKELINHKFLTAEEAASLLKFTCVRNPFDNLVSLYVKKAKQYQSLLSDPSSWIYRIPGYAEDMGFCRTHSFDEWILKRYATSPFKRFLGLGSQRSLYEKFTEGVDIVIRFETLQDDFQNVLKKAGVPFELTIPPINRTAERASNYRQYYNRKSQMAVRHRFHKDLERYNYRF